MFLSSFWLLLGKADSKKHTLHLGEKRRKVVNCFYLNFLKAVMDHIKMVITLMNSKRFVIYFKLHFIQSRPPVSISPARESEGLFYISIQAFNRARGSRSVFFSSSISKRQSWRLRRPGVGLSTQSRS